MHSRGRTSTDRKRSGEDWHYRKTKRSVMEKRSPTSSVCNLDHHHHHHHHHHRHHRHPSSPFSPLCLQSDDPCYLPSVQSSLEVFGSPEEECVDTLQASSSSCWGVRESSNSSQVFQNTSGSSSDREASLGGHFDGESGTSRCYENSWCGSGKREAWLESGERSADHFNGKGGNYGDVGVWVGENEILERISANHSDHTNSRGAAYCRAAAGALNDGNGEYYRSDLLGSRLGEDQLQFAELEGPWFHLSAHEQMDWRGDGNCPTAKTYTQKLDSFSEAFLSQRKKGCLMFPSGNPSWEPTAGGGTCGEARSSQSYPPPPLPCFQSFPSTLPSSHPMPSVLSPPPTPLPPASFSPSKLDSPTASPGREPHCTAQFFPPHLQRPHTVLSAGMGWKFPPPSQESSEPTHAECSLREEPDEQRVDITAAGEPLPYPEPSNCSSPFSPTGGLWPHSSQSHPPPPPPFSSLPPSSLPPPPPPLPLPPPRPPLHLYRHSSQVSGKLSSTVQMLALHHGSHKGGQKPAGTTKLVFQRTDAQIYTGASFPSLLHSCKGQRRSHFTPRPLLNPLRKGAGLFSSVSSLHQRGGQSGCTEEEDGSVTPCINIGPDFQADLPAFSSVSTGSEVKSAGDEAVGEHLLWKPSDELEGDLNIGQQVEELVSMCSSSCLPGGGSNIELALHCLHSCQGNTMDTLEMLLFSHPSPAGDYHYSGSDHWTDPEKRLFTAALRAYGKDFSFIKKMVGTRSVSQCVEFYYLSWKLQRKQEKQMRDEDLEQQQRVTPLCRPMGRQYVQEEVVPAPSLAGLFPCKLCGKMFYKIKSRNAHMKIHRQPQDDWMDRRAQHKMIGQHLMLSHPTNIMQSSHIVPTSATGFTYSTSAHTTTSSSHATADTNTQDPVNGGYPGAGDGANAVLYSYITAPNSHLINSIKDSCKKETINVLPLHQSWGSFGHQADPGSFYHSPEGGVGSGEAADQVNWE